MKSSIAAKLTLTTLAGVVLTAGLLVAIGSSVGRSALMEEQAQALEGIRSSRRTSIERYFDFLRRHGGRCHRQVPKRVLDTRL